MAKIVLITGATSGFGLACAEKFASHGFDLIINGRRSERLNQIATDLERRFNVAVFEAAFDVRDEKAVFETIRNLPSPFDQVDILINNAGLALGRDYFEEASMDDWNVMVDTNIKGFMYVAKAVAEKMAARNAVSGTGGHIINMGSVAGKQVYEKGNAYCATKFAVDALNKAMRVDLLRHNIKVTGIHPGAAETEFSVVRFKGDETTAKKIYEGFKPLTAMDVADVVYYCCTLPAHVCINDLEITCTQQANAIYFNKSGA